MELQLSYFKILKDYGVIVLHSIWQQIWKTQQWPQDWKMLILIPISKKGNAKGCSNHRTIALVSHASKVMLKILQTRLQQYVNCELCWTYFQMFKVDLEKAEETEIKPLTSAGSSKKWQSSRKTSVSALLTTSKPLTVWIRTNWKILKEMRLTCLWEICIQVRKKVRIGHVTTDWFQTGKGVCKAVFFTLLI